MRVYVSCPKCGSYEINLAYYKDCTEYEGDYQKPVMQCNDCLYVFKKDEACFSDEDQ